MKGTVAIRCPWPAATSARTVSSVTRAQPVPRRPARRRRAAHPPKGCSGRDIALTIPWTWPRTPSSTAAGCAARSCARSSARSCAPTADTRATAPIPERSAVAVTIDEALRQATAEAARGVVTFPADLHGFPGTAHGGAVAAVFHRLTLPRPPVALRVELIRGCRPNRARPPDRQRRRHRAPGVDAGSTLGRRGHAPPGRARAAGHRAPARSVARITPSPGKCRGRRPASRAARPIPSGWASASS